LGFGQNIGIFVIVVIEELGIYEEIGGRFVGRCRILVIHGVCGTRNPESASTRFLASTGTRRIL
jgi:hypothetical protein